MKVLVTGGSGHLGANLVRTLMERGDDVRALYRAESDNSGLDGLDIEKVEGDLRDIDAMRRAVKGVDRIYHCAAKISTLDADEAEVFSCNVIGTRNILQAAREAKNVGRIVVTGSFSAVGKRYDGPSDETIPFNPFDRAMPYEKSKAGVEHECLKAVVEGQDVVVATSCAILGPNDFKPSRMGRMIKDFAAGKMLAYIPGGFEFVAARDLVAGHLLAMEKGRTGHKYIFSTQFTTVDEIMEMLSRITGRRKPPFRLHPSVMAAIAHVTHFIGNNFFPSYPQRLTPGAVRILRLQRKADISKAKNELGYQPSSIEDALREQHEFFLGLKSSTPIKTNQKKSHRAA